MTTPRRKWKSSLFGCFSYRTPENESMCCPYFFPMSVLGTCCAAGRIVTKLEKEDPICLQIGPKGACTCVLSNAIFGPAGWLLCGFCLRKQVIAKYNVEEDGNPCCNCICYPCSYFQMLVSMNEWDQEKEVAHTGTNTLHNPIIR